MTIELADIPGLTGVPVATNGPADVCVTRDGVNWLLLVLVFLGEASGGDGGLD